MNLPKQIIFSDQNKHKSIASAVRIGQEVSYKNNLIVESGRIFLFSEQEIYS